MNTKKVIKIACACWILFLILLSVMVWAKKRYIPKYRELLGLQITSMDGIKMHDHFQLPFSNPLTICVLQGPKSIIKDRDTSALWWNIIADDGKARIMEDDPWGLALGMGDGYILEYSILTTKEGTFKMMLPRPVVFEEDSYYLVYIREKPGGATLSRKDGKLYVIK